MTTSLKAKAQLLATMQRERAQWNALLAEIGPARLILPHVIGDWSIKDIVAHITFYEQRTVADLQAAKRGEVVPAPHEALQLDLEGRNRWIWEHHRNRSLPDILAEAEQVFGALLAAVQMFTDEELTDADLFPWTHGEPLGEGYISGNAYEHYHEHLPAIRAWLNQQQ